MKQKSLNILTGLPLAIVLALVSGCADLKQNPLEGKGAAIEDAQPPQTKPEIPAPVESDALRIDGPELVSFREGEENKVIFSMRSLLEGYTGQIKISNLAAYPGATFDATSGEFKWAPPVGTVFTGFFQEMVLKLEAVAQPAKQGDAILFIQKEVRLLVQKVARNPVIKSVEVKDALMRENGIFYVKVVVMDPEGTLADAEKPRLIVSNGNLKGSIASHVTEYGNRGDLSKKEWTIDLKINLTGVELTDSVIATSFDIVALNRYGLFSPSVRVNTNVATDFIGVDSSIEMNNEVIVGEKNIIPFTVFDPKAEAVVTIKSVRGLPADAQLKCNVGNKIFMQKCKIVWQPDQKELLKVYTVYMELELRNKSNLDNRKDSRTISFNLTTVNSAASPLPNPGLPVEGEQ